MTTDSDLTIAELRIAVAECEDTIRAAIARLKDRTGLTPASIDIDFHEVTMLGQRPQKVVGQVTVRMEL